MAAAQHIPRGMNHWAVFAKSGHVGSFQSREQAQKHIQALGGSGYDVRFGKFDRSGAFVPDDWREDKTR